MDFSGLILAAGGITGGFVGGFVAGAVVGWFKDASVESRLDSLEARFQRAHNASVAGSGAEARIAKEERMGEAIAMAAELMAKEEYKGKHAEVLKIVASQYPDVAFSVIQKVMKGKGLGGLGAMLGA
jgi:hypothetical protein